MKLDRIRPLARARWILSVVAAAVAPAVLLAGCASHASSRGSVTEAPTAPVVGTAHLMTAELTANHDAPRFGKSHRASLVEENGAKEAPDRRTSGRPGGGFSGYK